MTREGRQGLLYAALAVLFFSTSPIFILWADPMHPIVKTWGRMLVAAIAVGGLALLTQSQTPRASERVDLTPRSRCDTILRFMAYGLIAALHFVFYIASLSFTTAAHTLAIVYTAPIFVALCSAIFLKEPIRGRQWVGVGIAVLGVAVLAGLEPRMDWSMAFGDLLALLSAIAFGFYSIAGRYERNRYPLFTYAYRVYGMAALWTLPAALLVMPQMPSEGWGLQQIASVIAVGLGSLALGHTLYNAALRRLQATYVNIIASQEVTGGIILSWLLLNQVPSLNSIAGALVTLVGIIIVLR